MTPTSSLFKDEEKNPRARRVFRSEELFQHDREILILHGDSQYRLLITKAGKLILNK
jgi:hemin uptake protein HemP